MQNPLIARPMNWADDNGLGLNNPTWYHATPLEKETMKTFLMNKIQRKDGKADDGAATYKAKPIVKPKTWLGSARFFRKMFINAGL